MADRAAGSPADTQAAGRVDNETMMQYFEWYLPNDGLLWRRTAAKAKILADMGITQIWLPPAYKGTSQSDVGYGVYDLYDLGEFDQKGTVRTKYGTKAEYLGCVRMLQKAGIQVFADLVLNQRLGADEVEEVTAVEVSPDDRNREISGEQQIGVWTKFTFPGRAGKYSQFIWDWTDFSGIDYDEWTKRKGIFRFAGKKWDDDTDDEHGNYDYLLGADVDTDKKEVREEIARWIAWYLWEVGFDGVRLDAVKHISSQMFRDALAAVNEAAGRPVPAVGEYWSPDLGRLQKYLADVNDAMSLFDVPLHFKFFNASRGGGGYPMRSILDGTLVQARPDKAVTFVDNHDTEPGQSLESYVESWFKPLAYALILLRQEGIPCVFYGDFYGVPTHGIPSVPGLSRMIRIRKLYAYGRQIDYFDDDNIIGWTRGGDLWHRGSGIAVLMSDGPGGSKWMEVGKPFAGMTMRDALGTVTDPVTVNQDGWAEFRTAGGNVAVWVMEDSYAELMTAD